ncbi:MAG: DUF4959 domain-containing protein [Prevotellaceae bacterium]|jgi:hypothetical protein|nr:DUF4959 domain-containing protein [Prevotellaceae bacterium]
MNIIIKNFAKISHTWKSAYFILIALLVMACTEDKIGQQPTDSLPPSPLKEAEAIGISGGALVTYVLPDNDTDISYVRGEYVIDGETRIIRSSVYKDYFFVEGLETNVTVDINLYVVDHSENKSTPLKKTFTTLEAPYASIANSIEISPSIGGIVLRWDNPERLSTIGVVLLKYDTLTKKMKEHAVTFEPKGAVFYAFPFIEQTFGAYVIDKWGHFSDTTFITTTPVPETWLDRLNMRGYAIGNDALLATADPNNGYYSGAERLFDGMARSLGTAANLLSASAFGVFSSDGTMPIYYTIDLGVYADVSRFWIEPRGHSTYGRYAFGQNGGASPFNWDLWGTTTDFRDSASVDFKEGDDPYWTTGQWKQDKRWKYMGNYTHRRPSDPNATPDNPGARSGAAWDADLAATYAPPSLTNPTNFPINELGVGTVRYIRFEFNRSWSDENGAMFHELWFWGGIIEEVSD